MLKRESNWITRALTLAVLCAVALTTSPLLAATIINEDFQNQTAGTNPVPLFSSGTNTPVGTVIAREDVPNGRIVNVVDSTTSPVDPFGPIGNKSLQLYSESTTGASVFFRSSSPGLTSGTLALNALVSTTPIVGSEGPWFSVILGGTTGTSLGGNSTDGITRIDFRNTGRIAVRYNGGLSVADQVYTANTNYLIEITFDTDTDLFSVTLNDSPLTTGSGSVSSWTPLSTSLASVNAVYVSGYDAIDPGQAFVDNIILTDIPEPAGVVLLAAGGLLMLLRQRR